MAERRMFAKTIIDSDAFLEMPQSSQLLYFHLSMRADDEGFVNKPKTVMRMLGSKDDDMNVLILRKFILPFDSGIVVIKHWRIHNYLQKDRIIETKYLKEKEQLELDENKAYRMIKDECIHNTSELYTQVSIDKSNIDKISIVKDIVRFKKPNLDEIIQYIREENLKVDENVFFDYYESNGWVVGKNKMKDWKATLRNWSRKEKEKNTQETSNPFLKRLKEIEKNERKTDFDDTFNT